MKNNEIILYQSGNQSVHIEVRFKDETVWLTQAQIAELFGIQRPAITKHLKNIYKSGELIENSTCSILEHMGADGVQKYRTKYYNLDIILSVGYRVNSINATHFRIWANKVLKEYLLKGYAVSNRINKVENEVYLMTTILIKPKSKGEKNLLIRLLKKMNIEVQVVEEPMPNYETRKAMEDVEKRKGIRTKDSRELFNTLGI